VIIEWTVGRRYLDSPGYAVTGPYIDAQTTGAGFGLVSRPGLSFLWTQYSEQPSAEVGVFAQFALIYRPGLGFIWIQYASGSSGIANWQSDGAGTCEFTGPDQPVIQWQADGIAGGVWQLWADQIHGFNADGVSSCTFFSGGNLDGVLLMQGQGGAGFVLETGDPALGFRADGTSTCRWIGPRGTGEECLTAQEAGEWTGVGGWPNYVF
jgi:hypothetical protein